MKIIHDRQLNSRGDTIIEVLLALSILTLILFTSWNLVNRSTQVGLNARKRTDMVNQLKEQAEIITAANAQNAQDYNAFEKLVFGNPSVVNESDATYEEAFCSDSPTEPAGGKVFYMQGSASGLESTPKAKKVGGNDGSLVWVQYNESESANGYVDFYVRGCWTTLGGEQKTDNAQFIVRVNKGNG